MKRFLPIVMALITLVMIAPPPAQAQCPTGGSGFQIGSRNILRKIAIRIVRRRLGRSNARSSNRGAALKALRAWRNRDQGNECLTGDVGVRSFDTCPTTTAAPQAYSTRSTEWTPTTTITDYVPRVIRTPRTVYDERIEWSESTRIEVGPSTTYVPQSRSVIDRLPPAITAPAG